MKIRWTAVAANDLKATYEYVREDSVAHANKLIERILSSVEMLERHPHLGREGRLEGTREMVITGTPFIVFYRIRQKQIEILGVLHAARKWPDSI